MEEYKYYLDREGLTQLLKDLSISIKNNTVQAIELDEILDSETGEIIKVPKDENKFTSVKSVVNFLKERSNNIKIHQDSTLPSTNGYDIVTNEIVYNGEDEVQINLTLTNVEDIDALFGYNEIPPTTISETISFFDGTNEAASIPSNNISGTIEGFNCTSANFKTTLTDVHEYTNASTTYKVGLRYGGGTTNSKNYIKIDVPDGYKATINMVYSNQSQSNVFFGISTDGTKPNGTNCYWNTSAISKTISFATIDNLSGNTSYYVGGSSDQCLIIKLDVTINKDNN